MYKLPDSFLSSILKYTKAIADDDGISEEQLQKIRDLMAASYGMGVVTACCNDYVLTGDSALATLKEENFTEPAWEVIKEGQQKEFEFIAEFASAGMFT
jgi:hypothetical protein